MTGLVKKIYHLWKKDRLVMAKQKVTRKELLKKPDEFLTLSARAALFVREHEKAFTYAGFGLLAVVLIYVGINTYLNHVNKKGQSAYNEAYYELMARMNEEGEPKELEKPKELFQEVMTDYSRSKVSRLVPAQMAFLKFQDKKYDDAVALYLQFYENMPQGSPYRFLAGLALAACYEQKGEWQKAIGRLKDVIAGSGGAFKEQAMLSLARVYDLSNQKNEAKETLQDFVDAFPASPSLPMAKARLGELEADP
jgi:outer membrane protein assembly factor BamD (BamD/ComL family)